jgi:hypothetical protein
MPISAARRRQNHVGARNAREVLRLLAEERRYGYRRRLPDSGERVKPPAGPDVG